MKNLNQDDAQMTELKHEKSLASTEGADTNEGTSKSMKDPDTMLSMIVLFLACVALAALAQVFVS